MQAARGVDQHGVRLGLDTFPNSVERHSGRVTALGTAHHIGADPLAPGLELVGGGGPEGIRGAEDDLALFRNEHARDLPGRGGLAGAVHPDDEDDGGLAVRAGRGQRAVHVRVHEAQQLLGEDLLDGLPL